MLSVKPTPSRFVTVLFTLLIAVTFSLRLHAQDSNGKPQTHYIDDWSHHHLVFSNPGTKADAEKSGKLEEWNRITNDPRYQIQKGRREHGNRQVPDGPGGEPGWGDSHDRHGHDGGGNSASNKNGIEKDWSVPLGVGSTAATKATEIGTFSASPSSGNIVITNGANTLTLSSNATASHDTGTFTYPELSTENIKIVSGTNTLTITSAGVATEVFSGFTQPFAGSTLKIGNTVYDFETTNFNCVTGDRCVRIQTNTTTTADHLVSAIGGACYNACTGNDPDVTAINNGTTVYLVNTTAASVAVTTTGTTSITISTPIAIPSTTACTSSTAATIAPDNTAAVLATNFHDAINACPAAAGVSAATPVGGAVTVSNTTLGGSTISAFTDSETAGGFAWAGVTNGGVGTTACANPWTSGTFATSTSTSTLATNLNTAIGDCVTHTAIGVTAAASTNTVTVTDSTAGPAGNSITVSSAVTGFTWGGTTFTGGSTATVQPNAYPAKWGASLTTASCANDYVVYPVGQPGASGAATIVAYNNLYPGTPVTASVCGSSGPSVYFAFNTHTGYTVATSPVLSWDGLQLAFIESNGTSAELVIMKVSAAGGTIAAPAAITSVSTTSFRGCTAPCMTTVPFTNTNDDTLSAPYYDFSATSGTPNDALYVGDDKGYLHKFSGVFLGSPSEVTSVWPVSLGTAMASSPVYDPSSGYVFVGDMGGILYSVTGATGAIHGTTGTSVPLGDAIADAPMVDSTQGTVFVSVTTSGSYSETGLNAIYQFGAGFTAFGFPGVEPVGTGGAGYYLYDGDFDNVFYQSATGTGSLWVVGNTGATTGANLYRVGVSGGSLSGVTTAVTALTTNTFHPWPSPVTEFCNGPCTSNGTITTGTGSADYIYFSVYEPINTTKTGCTAGATTGCIVGYNVTTPTAPTLAGGQAYTTPASPGCWATGGIVIDNDATTTGASEIYFVNLAGAAAGGQNGNTSSVCAVGGTPTTAAIQAAQSAP